MNPEAQPAAGKPSGLFGLSRKQTRMLTYAFFAFALVAIGLGVYGYISSAPSRAQEQFQEAMKSMKPGHYQDAIVGFDRAVKTWPGLADAYYERGNAYRVLGRMDDAIADFEKAVDVNPGLYRAWAELGAIYRDRHDMRRAMEAYTKSIDAKPNVDAFYERGQTYESVGEHQKAIEDYNRAILEMPESPSMYRARSLARRNIGDQAGYEEDRDRANRIDHGR